MHVIMFMIRKLFYIIVLIVFLLQSCGILFLLQFQQLQVKASMQEMLNDPGSRLEKIILTEKEYHACRIDSHEIILNGEMYDIKEITKDGDVITILAIHDKYEENILEMISGFFQVTGNEKGKSGTQPVKYKLLVYDLPMFVEITRENDQQRINYFFDPGKIESCFKKILTPPPQFSI